MHVEYGNKALLLLYRHPSDTAAAGQLSSCQTKVRCRKCLWGRSRLAFFTHVFDLFWGLADKKSNTEVLSLAGRPTAYKATQNAYTTDCQYVSFVSLCVIYACYKSSSSNEEETHLNKTKTKSRLTSSPLKREVTMFVPLVL